MIRTLFAGLVIAVISTEPHQRVLNHNASSCLTGGLQRATNKREKEGRADLRVLHAAVPIYPALARVAQVSGIVEVRVTVKRGLVVGTEVISGRQAVLTRAAADNIRSWTFPAWVNTAFTTRFEYRLQNKKQLDPQNPRVELQLPFFARITALSTRDRDLLEEPNSR